MQYRRPMRQEIVYRFQGRRDGAGGYADLLYVGRTLYGTTSHGGVFHRGSVFELSATRSEKCYTVSNTIRMELHP
jgi:hypothetical protein